MSGATFYSVSSFTCELPTESPSLVKLTNAGAVKLHSCPVIVLRALDERSNGTTIVSQRNRHVGGRYGKNQRERNVNHTLHVVKRSDEIHAWDVKRIENIALGDPLELNHDLIDLYGSARDIDSCRGSAPASIETKIAVAGLIAAASTPGLWLPFLAEQVTQVRILANQLFAALKFCSERHLRHRDKCAALLIRGLLK